MMSWRVFQIAALLVAVAASDLQGIVGGQETLVLLDSLTVTQSHSKYFQNLADQGHQLTFLHADSPDVSLKKYGEYFYDNIILVATSAEDFEQIGTAEFVQFVNDGGNILIIADASIGSGLRQLAAAVGIRVDPKDSVAIDHFATEPSLDHRYCIDRNTYQPGSLTQSCVSPDFSLQHTVFQTRNFISNSAILGEFGSSSAPVLFNGVAHAIDQSNILAVRILRGNPSTYSANPDRAIKPDAGHAGADVLLVSGMQARNNARVTFAGSTAMFSNRYFTATVADGKQSGNELFCSELSKWALGQRGVLRFRDVVHHKLDGSQPDVMLHEKAHPDLPTTMFPDPEIARNSLVYRIKDDITYSFTLEHWNEDRWEPYVADDVQLEFIMLDPYVRKTMTSDKDGRYSVTFKAPDTYGIFKFRVMYRRPGYSTININTQVAVRPFKHNEYERFIFSAFPYYGSAFSMMIGFFIFSVAFFFSSDK